MIVVLGSGASTRMRGFVALDTALRGQFVDTLGSAFLLRWSRLIADRSFALLRLIPDLLVNLLEQVDFFVYLNLFDCRFDLFDLVLVVRCCLELLDEPVCLFLDVRLLDERLSQH